MKARNDIRANISLPINKTKTMGIGHGLSANDVTETFARAVQDEIAENKKQGFPVAKYDAKIKQAYLENPDGTREYVNG